MGTHTHTHIHTRAPTQLPVTSSWISFLLTTELKSIFPYSLQHRSSYLSPRHWPNPLVNLPVGPKHTGYHPQGSYLSHYHHSVHQLNFVCPQHRGTGSPSTGHPPGPSKSQKQKSIWAGNIPVLGSTEYRPSGTIYPTGRTYTISSLRLLDALILLVHIRRGI